MRRWDEFSLLVPGSYVLAGPEGPIIVPEHANKFQLEGIRGEVEVALNALTAGVEARVAQARRTKRERKRYQGRTVARELRLAGVFPSASAWFSPISDFAP